MPINVEQAFQELTEDGSEVMCDNPCIHNNFGWCCDFWKNCEYEKQNGISPRDLEKNQDGV